MTPIDKVIKKHDVNINPIWIMRQAGRYLPEFREIREKNTDFIKLCLNENLSSEITLQPLKRFDFDAAIIFSDILMLPYGLGQKVELEKNCSELIKELNLSNKDKKEVQKTIMSFCENYEKLCQKKYPEAPLPLEILKSVN